MKNCTEDEKPQGTEGAQFGSGKQGFKKNTTTQKSQAKHSRGILQGSWF